MQSLDGPMMIKVLMIPGRLSGGEMLQAKKGDNKSSSIIDWFQKNK